MNFGFNDEQELLRNTARKFFENECGSDTVRRLMETSEGMSPELWKKIAEQGWLGLIYPEAYDGLGLGLVDLVVLMEEMGRAVVPGPFFSSVLLGGLASDGAAFLRAAGLGVDPSEPDPRPARAHAVLRRAHGRARHCAANPRPHGARRAASLSVLASAAGLGRGPG